LTLLGVVSLSLMVMWPRLDQRASDCRSDLTPDEKRLTAFDVSIVGDKDLEKLCLFARRKIQRAQRRFVVAASRCKPGIIGNNRRRRSCSISLIVRHETLISCASLSCVNPAARQNVFAQNLAGLRWSSLSIVQPIGLHRLRSFSDNLEGQRRRHLRPQM